MFILICTGGSFTKPPWDRRAPFTSHTCHLRAKQKFDRYRTGRGCSFHGYTWLCWVTPVLRCMAVLSSTNCQRFIAVTTCRHELQTVRRGSPSSPTPSAVSLAEIPESQIEPRPREPLECIAPSLHGSLTPWVQESICRKNVFGCFWANMVVPLVPCFHKLSYVN